MIKINYEQTGELKHCNSAYFTFLAIEDGKPAPVPQLVPETDEDKKRLLSMK
jgi:acyl-CoA hydrolase